MVSLVSIYYVDVQGILSAMRMGFLADLKHIFVYSDDTFRS